MDNEILRKGDIYVDKGDYHYPYSAIIITEVFEDKTFKWSDTSCMDTKQQSTPVRGKLIEDMVLGNFFENHEKPNKEQLAYLIKGFEERLEVVKSKLDYLVKYSQTLP